MYKYNGVGEKFRSLISSSVLSVSWVVSPRKISRVMQYQDRMQLRGLPASIFDKSLEERGVYSG